MMRALKLALVSLFICLTTLSAIAQTAGNFADETELRGIDDQVQGLKSEVIQINNELALLEEKLIYPSTTQVSVFVSLEGEEKFRLDAATILINDKIVSEHIYNFRELQALLKGGVQRIYTGNVGSGDHQVSLQIAGQSPGGESFEQQASFEFTKGVDPKFIELRVTGDSANPQIDLRNW